MNNSAPPGHPSVAPDPQYDALVMDAVRTQASLLAPAGDGLVMFDRDLTVLYCTSAMRAFGTRPYASVHGLHLFAVFPAWETGSVRAPIEAALDNRHSELWIRDLVAGAGTDESYQTFCLPLLDREGANVGGMVLVRTPDRSRAVDHFVGETEQKFKTMADCSPVLLWMSETDALCSFFNQTWLDFTGRTLEQEYGVGWASGVHPEDFERCMNVYMDHFARRTPFEMEYRIRHKSGEYRWLLDRGAPRYRPDGAFAGFIGSCTDITDRVVAQAELQAALARLNHAHQDLERFSYIASHDLRAPLVNVIRVSRALTEDLSEGHFDDLAEHVRWIQDRVNQIMGLLEGLLEYSKAGRDNPELERCDVRQLLEEIWEFTPHDGFDLSIHGDSPSLVTAQVPLRHVLSNLLGNAVKHHDAVKHDAAEPHGERTGRVKVSIRQHENTIELFVTDDGPGIPAEFMDQIFLPFQTLKPRDQGGGSGLGLSLVQRLVEGAGGTISVTSPVADGRGTSMRIAWPLVWRTAPAAG